MTTKQITPRDLDEVDLIRTAPRETALEFYLACLKCAYHRGAIDNIDELRQLDLFARGKA
jgi:hypothetical protein